MIEATDFAVIVVGRQDYRVRRGGRLGPSRSSATEAVLSALDPKYFSGEPEPAPEEVREDLLSLARRHTIHALDSLDQEVAEKHFYQAAAIRDPLLGRSL